MHEPGKKQETEQLLQQYIAEALVFLHGFGKKENPG